VRRFPLVLAVSVFLAVPGFAQKCSEQFIRSNISSKAPDQKLVTSDSYFFSGALDKPIIGVPSTPESKKADEKISKNDKYEPTVERVVVAPSGDMAYAYGTEHVSYDEVPDSKHVNFTAAFLMVWRVADGTCKIAASMYEPEGEK